MEKQFARPTEPGLARRSIVQLAAVLSVVRAVRIAEHRPEWRKSRLTLVDPADLRELLKAGVVAAFWTADGVASRSLDESDAEAFEELPTVIGLLAWLAWECGFEPDLARRPASTATGDSEAGILAQLATVLAPWLLSVPETTPLIRQSIEQTPQTSIDGQRWLSLQLEFSERVTGAMGEIASSSAGERAIRRGDLVLLPVADAPLRIALDVVPTASDVRVVVFDPQGKNERRTFVASKVKSILWHGAHVQGRIA